MSTQNGTPALVSNPSITIPIVLLRKLLFCAFEDLEIITPQSPLLGDFPQRIKIYPYEVGQLFQQLDPAETYFHVELINNPAYDIQRWAEIWDNFGERSDWKESNARRYRSKEASAKRIQEHTDIETKRKHRQGLMEELEASLAANPTWRSNPAARQQLVIAIVDNYKQHNLIDMLQKLDLLETLTEYEKNTH